MKPLSKRIAALEGQHIGADVDVLAIMERETDLTGWLFTEGGNQAEKSAVLDCILKWIDGQSKGLPIDRTSALEAVQ